ncbi:hypothetical protein [Egbenema bharatensis]|uniref:hypothetical protein n=1 Tax=Egbenema bharatensis TaxID=3463334 RepID=UPI003A892A8B
MSPKQKDPGDSFPNRAERDRRGKKPQTNPRSLANLTHEGRPLAYDQPKKTRAITVTEDGWRGFQALADGARGTGAKGLSASELVESLGRGTIDLRQPMKQLMSPETLAKLNLTPVEVLEMPLLELLVRMANLDK